jgi:hypothetical protein
MTTMANVWQRVRTSDGYTHKVIVQAVVEAGEIVGVSTQAFSIGPRGGSVVYGAFGLSLAEWDEINEALRAGRFIDACGNVITRDDPDHPFNAKEVL